MQSMQKLSKKEQRVNNVEESEHSNINSKYN